VLVMLNFTPVIVSDLDSNLRKPKEYLTYHYHALRRTAARPGREIPAALLSGCNKNR
jgi:hypothetical protein